MHFDSTAFLRAPSDNRDLETNQLTSLGVGVFDKNTALVRLYVDQANGERGRPGQLGKVLRTLKPNR